MANYTTDRFVSSIQAQIRAEMDKLVEDEAEAAAERVRAKAREMAPRLALALMSNFDITKDRQDIIIRVRNEGAA